MDTIVVQNPSGHFDISGSVALQGSKNAGLINIALPLLTSDECVFTNIPAIADVEQALSFLRCIGADVRWDGQLLYITCDNIVPRMMDPQHAMETTHSSVFIPLLVSRFGEFVTGAPGGCPIGDRAFGQYVKTLSKMGVACEPAKSGTLRFFSTEEFTNDITLPFPSYSSTISAVLLAMTHGSMVIHNPSEEPEIDNVLQVLTSMGAHAQRAGSRIEVAPPDKFNGGRFRNMSDRNVAVTYAVMALITGSELSITNFDDDKMDAFYQFLEIVGIAYHRQNQVFKIPSQDVTRLRATQVDAYIYPSFHSDWQPLVAPLLCLFNGTSRIEERLFPNRLGYWEQLALMGAKYSETVTQKSRFQDNFVHAVEISGPCAFHGANVKALDLRGAAALLEAALIARGTTCIHNAEILQRGYANIIDDLQSLSVTIEKEISPQFETVPKRSWKT
ncbi:MAG TPA: hypothetical protein VGZ00_04205 [Candidatus Baltobacteraceae bacterium]|nr:hypothetical protein [Candidatus Baltobacteraceae bacterium]